MAGNNSGPQLELDRVYIQCELQMPCLYTVCVMAMLSWYPMSCRWSLPMMMSITHRGTGVGLSGGIINILTSYSTLQGQLFPKPLLGEIQKLTPRSMSSGNFTLLLYSTWKRPQDHSPKNIMLSPLSFRYLSICSLSVGVAR